MYPWLQVCDLPCCAFEFDEDVLGHSVEASLSVFRSNNVAVGFVLLPPNHLSNALLEQAELAVHIVCQSNIKPFSQREQTHDALGLPVVVQQPASALLFQSFRAERLIVAMQRLIVSDDPMNA